MLAPKLWPVSSRCEKIEKNKKNQCVSLSSIITSLLNHLQASFVLKTQHSVTSDLPVRFAVKTS